MSFKVALQKPIKLDVTYSDNGICVQWNGDEWLAYDSEEAKNFRQKCFEEFKQKFPNRNL